MKINKEVYFVPVFLLSSILPVSSLYPGDSSRSNSTANMGSPCSAAKGFLALFSSPIQME